jgi:hypothetical protein
MGLPDEDDERAPREVGSQRPLELDPAAYVELGAAEVGIGPDGLPLMAGGAPRAPAPGLTADRFVCASAPGRDVCVHLGQLLLDAPGEYHGDDPAQEKPMRLARYCTRLAAQTELLDLTDTQVHACTLRQPPDPVSSARIERFEARQRAIAAAAETTSKTFEV